LNENEQTPDNDVEDLPHKGMVLDDSHPVSLSELTKTQSAQPDSKKS
jgi:hypothetical protein